MKFKFMRIWVIGFQPESNRRPRDWQSLALTNWATHIQKRKIVDLEKIECKHKSNTKHWAIQFIQKTPQYKDSCYSWTELNTINSKICPWSCDLLDVNFKYLFSFFLGLSATIPSAQKVEFWNFGNSETFESGAWTKCNSTRSRWGLPVKWLFVPLPKQATFFVRTYLNTLNFQQANPDYSLFWLNPRNQLFLITLPSCPVLSVSAKTNWRVCKCGPLPVYLWNRTEG